MSLFTELKRRNVIRVGVAYLIGAWIIVEISSVVLPIFGAPVWTLRALTFLLALIFIPVIVASWAFELTPEGVKRDSEVADAAVSRGDAARRLNLITILLVIGALGLLATERFLWAPTSQAASVAVTERSIAVLPFANRSAANDAASFFADGIHDDLLTNLSKFSDLQVISRTSVERYRSTELSIPQIAAELGVATILEGGVQHAGDRVRINVQLIDAATDQHIWAETYDEQLTTDNLFEIQRVMALRIAEALAAQLSSAEEEAVATRPTDDLAAYEAYQQGREALRTRNVSRMAEAVAHFQQAIELDPNFALAYIGVADAMLGERLYAGQGYAIDEAALAETTPYINQALALDPSLASAYVTLGIVHRRTEGYEIAELALRRALDLSPGDAQALHEYGSLLLELRRIDEAVEYLQRAAELAPLDARVLFDVAAANEAQGDLDEALRLYQRARTIDPGFSLIPSAIAWLYWDGYGRLDQAYQWQLKAIEIDPENPGLYTTMSHLFIDLGDYETATTWLDLAIGHGLPADGFAAARRDILVAAGRLEEAEHSAIQVKDDPGWRGMSARRLIASFELRRGETAMASAIAAEGLTDIEGNAIVLIDNRNDRNALRMAYLMKATGQTEEPLRLAAASRAIIRSGAPHGPLLYDIGYDVAWVQNHLVVGDTEAAMAALNDGVDSGWRYGWRDLLFYSVFEPLWDRPDFQALIAELESQMATQRAAIRAAGG